MHPPRRRGKRNAVLYLAAERPRPPDYVQLFMRADSIPDVIVVLERLGNPLQLQHLVVEFPALLQIANVPCGVVEDGRIALRE